MLKDTQLHILADSDEHEAVQQVQVNLHFPKIIPKICCYLDVRGYGFPYSGRIFMQSVALYLFHLSITQVSADLDGRFMGIVLQNER